MRGCWLAPKGLESNPAFRDAVYAVEDKSKVKDERIDSAEKKLVAISQYNDLVKGNFNKLVYILNSIGLTGVSHTLSTSTLTPLFFEWIENKRGSISDFLKEVENAKDPKKLEVMMLQYFCGILRRTGKITKLSDGLYFDGTKIGLDNIDAAMALAGNDEYRDIKVKIIDLVNI